MIRQRGEAIGLMNQFGERRIPFFFFTDFLGTRAWIKPVSGIDPGELSFAFHQGSGPDLPYPAAGLLFQKKPLPYEKFRSAFAYVVDQINIGNSYLVNLTFKTPIHTNFGLKDIFLHSKAKYKLLYNDRFVVFSPETFVKIKDGYIYAYPMKGTIDANIPDAQNKILSDPKETAEHVTIVDLIRNDLSQVACEVEVTQFRFITKVDTHEKSLLQVSSEIRGRLAENAREKLGDLLFQLLPAGSISGAPKNKTVEIIRQAEDYQRGFYTGVCGYFDGESLDSGVMIRFIEKEGDQLYYKSGGGITSFSEAEKEYQEIIDKIYVPVY